MNEKTTQRKTKEQVNGIPLKRVTIIFAIVMIVISILLMVGLYFNLTNYRSLLEVSRDYITWEEKAKEMMISSDYLTEQARSFIETGEREFMDNYFAEANELHRRDNALAYIGSIFPESDAFISLQYAMNESRKLMETEYRAFRFKGESLGDDISTYPEEVKNIVLTDEEQALSPAEKDSESHLLLFNHKYSSAKKRISDETDACLNKLVEELDARQKQAEYRARFAMIYELILIVIFIVISLINIYVTSNQVFNPLIRSIPFIENDSPLPVNGAYELRILAHTYNLMYEANRRNRNRLRFKAEHDPLTGALNRNAFKQVQNESEGGSLAFLILDVDNFKQINDSHGHLMGDHILVKVFELMRKNFRNDDCIFRMGGDEFAVVLFGLTPKDRAIINNIFDLINEGLVKNLAEGEPEVTLSAGVAFGNKMDQDLFERADTALYTSKHSGKSCCSFYKED